MSNQYASAGHLKRGDNIFGKNTGKYNAAKLTLNFNCK